MESLTTVLITDGLETDWSGRDFTALHKFNRVRISQLGNWGLIVDGAERYLSSVFFTKSKGLNNEPDLFADDRELLYQSLFTATIPENCHDWTHEIPTFPAGNYAVWTFPRQKGGLLLQLWYTE
jgi:hypothetical protein